MATSLKLNPNVIHLEYAVRGPIPQRAAEMVRQGIPTIPCNIGNPQALGQRPLTYFRQVLSLLEDPDRIARERAGAPAGHEPISAQLLDFAEETLGKLGTGMGAYTESNGPRFIREAVARFIDARDEARGDARDDAETTGAPAANPDAIFLTNGASEAVRHGLDMLVGGPKDGIMIPVPQYPLYSATIMKVGGTRVDYYPSEEDGWTMDRSTLEESLAGAKAKGITVKAVVVINPGNPTGAILPEESIREVIDFAEWHGLAIMADEVYQENLYGGAEFVSFAKVLGSREVPLLSFHSTSKGFYGECGHRGGYVEVRNPPQVEGTDVGLLEILYKLASVNLCSNTVGHLLTYLMVNRPDPGTGEHERFTRERDAVLAALETKATMIREAFTRMDGVECFGRTGAMYLFPRLGTLPAGKTDFDYCMELLEKTGLCTVNGSGFGQAQGTHHLRIAFLPPTELLEEVLPRWIEFHEGFVRG